MTITILLIVVAIIFLSSLTRSALGFGDALIAMPLLTMVIDIKTTTPVVGLVATTIAVVILGSNWQHADFHAAWRLIIASLAGIPIGIFLLTSAPEAFVKAVLGIVLILFSTYSLLMPHLPSIEDENYGFLFGFVAGILGGAYNTNGPPAVIYGSLRQWPPRSFRVTLQAYFFPTGFMILAGHALAGLWTAAVFKFYLAALPAILIAIWLGGIFNRRIDVRQFGRVVYLFLLIIGIMMVIRR